MIVIKVKAKCSASALKQIEANIYQQAKTGIVIVDDFCDVFASDDEQIEIKHIQNDA